MSRGGSIAFMGPTPDLLEAKAKFHDLLRRSRAPQPGWSVRRSGRRAASRKAGRGQACHSLPGLPRHPRWTVLGREEAGTSCSRGAEGREPGAQEKPPQGLALWYKKKPHFSSDVNLSLGASSILTLWKGLSLTSRTLWRRKTMGAGLRLMSRERPCCGPRTTAQPWTFCSAQRCRLTQESESPPPSAVPQQAGAVAGLGFELASFQFQPHPDLLCSLSPWCHRGGVA